MKISIIILVIAVSLIPSVYSHGVGFEILPPQQLGDKMVSLQVTSSQYEDPDSADREIQFLLFDIKNDEPIKDTTLHIQGKKGDEFLFKQDFVTTSGIFTFDLLASDSLEVKIIQENKANPLESLIGIKKDVIQIQSSLFETGGLYTFDVKIVEAEFQEIDPPIQWNVGLSILDKTTHGINDLNFGFQQIQVITYYDKIKNFNYDLESHAISFEMPFIWEFDNINETSIVHQEFRWSKSFGDLMVSEFIASINGYDLPQRVIAVDESLKDQRTIHIIIPKVNLLEIYEKQDESSSMNFVLKPLKKDLPVTTVTENSQFRITLDSQPKEIKSGQDVKFLFKITDVFLKDRPIAVSYDIIISHKENIIYQTSGTSTESREQDNEFTMIIPENISGPIVIEFKNLDGNSLARATLPALVDKITADIPDWIKDNAGWWSEGKITDKEFILGIEFMIKEQIIKIPFSASNQSTSGIPDWIKDNAGWWSEGKITDKEFVNALQFLIENSIIHASFD